MVKGILNITERSPVAKLSVLTIVVITTVMTLSMQGYVLAIGEPGYRLTVNIPSYPSGISTIGISITTANGYTDHANVDVSGVTSWTFNIPSNQGSSVRVCINSDSSSGENCSTYDTTGTDISVSLSPPSGNNYYVYPGNTYYIYPGNSYGHYHDRDHWLSGHQDSSNNGVGHRDTGNVVNGGNQNNGNNGVGGYGEHQDHWLGGHQDNGNTGYGSHQNSGNNGFSGHQGSENRGVTHPDHLHHLTKGAPIINAESSDDDSD